MDFNAETKRISLSKKALEPAPERAPRTSSPRRKKEEVSNDFTDKVEANTLGSMIAAAMGEEIPAEEPAVEETAAAVEEAAPEVTED